MHDFDSAARRSAIYLARVSRPLRIEFAGALYHVMARGNARQAIVVDDHDRRAFLSNLARVSVRFQWRLWSYCLMDNHYHLLLETGQPTLSRGMREINGVYSQAFNRRHGRVGHLLQGRYRAALVDKNRYLMELTRYIVLNPVRAQLCESAADWKWSAYRAIMGMTTAPEGLAVDTLLGLFADNRRAARRAFARFVTEGLGFEVPAQHQQLYLGDEKFVEQIARRAGPTSPEVPRRQRPARSLEAYARAHHDRDGAIRAAYESGTFTLSEIGDHFGLHHSMISRIARTKSQIKT